MTPVLKGPSHAITTPNRSAVSRAVAIVIVLEVETPPTIVVTAASISIVPNKALERWFLGCHGLRVYSAFFLGRGRIQSISLRFHSFNQCNSSPRKGPPPPYGEAQWGVPDPRSLVLCAGSYSTPILER
jgi:hypothetical protein